VEYIGDSIVYRLIWFQHIHKAAGTLIVNMAKANNEKMYFNNNNGNPTNDSGVVLPIWEYSDHELSEFIDNCQKNGITFVATESGAPNFSILEMDNRVTLITCLRDPEKRLISNHNYAYYSGYTEEEELVNFIHKPNIFLSDNYYVRIFSNNGKFPDKLLTEEDYQYAIKNISKFDLIINLDHDNIQEKLKLKLDWKNKRVDRHSTYGNKWNIINLIKKLQFRKLKKYLKREKIDMDISCIKNKYNLDYRLMDEIFRK